MLVGNVVLVGTGVVVATDEEEEEVAALVEVGVGRYQMMLEAHTAGLSHTEPSIPITVAR